MESDADVDSEDQLNATDSSIKNNSKKRKETNNDSSTKKKRKFEKDLYKQPTVEELNQLRETENLFHSNLFRLQIEEVLSAVKIKNKYKKLFDTWFKNFENHVNAIEDTKEFELRDDALFEDCNIKIPMKKLPNDCVGTIKFVRPSSITIGGSYLLDTIVGPDVSVDVLVEMPENLFKKIDCKNYRYMRKKAVYLAYIGSKIDKELAEKKSFVGNHMNPILKIVPNGELNKRVVVYVHVVVQETAFHLNKFTAEKNNVRPNWYFKESDRNDVVNPPTPHYNNTVLHDLTALKINAQNAKLIKEYPNIRDGIILLKIWLRQREFSNNFETFNGHVITTYVLYLLQLKKLNTFMSSYQIVRNTWQHLARSNWCKEGISLCQDGQVAERIVEYHKHYDCVFLDFTGFQNLAANILEPTYKWISSQAEQSMECLNNTRINSFQLLFMRKVPFYIAFDRAICLHNPKALKNVLNANSLDADKLNYGPSQYMQATKFVLKLLKEGLGNRVSLVATLPRKLREWDMSEEIPDDLERLYIGLQLDPNYAFNIIEKGPAANLPEAATFRKFWGSKSELRRFKDGTICEAIVWTKETAPLARKRAIPQFIAEYLIEEKLKLFKKIHYSFFSDQMEQFIRFKKAIMPRFRLGPEEASLRAIKIFDSLEKELTGLTDLPLSISGVQGCSPLFRYADVFPPLACVRRPDKKNVDANKTHLLLPESDVEKVPIYLAPIEATVQLSTSGKWPDDLEALRMTKAAFHIQIAECMRKQYKLRAQANLRHIDVMKDGLVFRLRIAHQKEIGLVKQQVGEDGVIKYRDNEESMELEEKLFHLPRITGALYGLHCQQPSFGPTCCLAKRWLSAQLIDDSHMPDVAVELLVAALYLNPDPYRPAQAPQAAFLRFLEYFAQEHWITDATIVNFNNEMTREEIIEVENLFGESRNSLPDLFITTPYDKSASVWTRRAPSEMILHRISALARESLRILEVQLFDMTYVNFQPLLKPPLTEYDCLIELNSSLDARRLETTGVDKNSLPTVDLLPFQEHPKTKIPVIGFNPVAEYLSELRSIYNDHALFFHDTYGGSIIGVLFKPDALQEKVFKFDNTNCQKFNKDNKLVLNISAMIEDFYIIGKGLVKTINIQSKKLNAI